MHKKRDKLCTLKLYAQQMSIKKNIIKLALKGLNIIKELPLKLIKKSTQKIIDNSVKNMGKGKKIDLDKYKE